MLFFSLTYPLIDDPFLGLNISLTHQPFTPIVPLSQSEFLSIALPKISVTEKFGCMSYLRPPFEHDVFVSYAHGRGERLKHWSQCLADELKSDIQQLQGASIQHTKEIRENSREIKLLKIELREFKNEMYEFRAKMFKSRDSIKTEVH